MHQVDHGHVPKMYHAYYLKNTQNVTLEFRHFPPFFVPLKLTCLVTLLDRKFKSRDDGTCGLMQNLHKL